MMPAAPSMVQRMPDCMARWTTIALQLAVSTPTGIWDQSGKAIAASFDGTGADEHAEGLEVRVAHPDLGDQPEQLEAAALQAGRSEGSSGMGHSNLSYSITQISLMCRAKLGPLRFSRAPVEPRGLTCSDVAASVGGLPLTPQGGSLRSTYRISTCRW